LLRQACLGYFPGGAVVDEMHRVGIFAGVAEGCARHVRPVGGNGHGQQIFGSRAKLLQVPETLRRVKFPLVAKDATANKGRVISRELPLQDGERLAYSQDAGVQINFLLGICLFLKYIWVVPGSRIYTAFTHNRFTPLVIARISF